MDGIRELWSSRTKVNEFPNQTSIRSSIKKQWPSASANLWFCSIGKETGLTPGKLVSEII